MLKVGRWRVSRPVAWVLAGLAGLILLALIGWAIWRVPQLFYSYVSDPKDRANAEATTRTGILAGLAGIAALVSLRFTARAAQVSQETFQLTRRGQLTERYTKAIDQLGSKTLDVRMGGIYALEQLVREFDSDQDQKTIVEVLSAFTREHSNPVYRYRSHLEWLGQEKQEQPVPEKRLAIEHVSNYPLPGDVQAAITVLGRLPLIPATQADLMGAYLRSVRLQPTNHLVGAQLGPVLDDKANLSEAKLVQVDLSKADLHQATLIKAKLDEANLTGAWLAGADLSGAHLRGANLTEAKLVGSWSTEFGTALRRRAGIRSHFPAKTWSARTSRRRTSPRFISLEQTSLQWTWLRRKD